MSVVFSYSSSALRSVSTFPTSHRDSFRFVILQASPKSFNLLSHCRFFQTHSKTQAIQVLLKKLCVHLPAHAFFFLLQGGYLSAFHLSPLRNLTSFSIEHTLSTPCSRSDPPLFRQGTALSHPDSLPPHNLVI